MLSRNPEADMFAMAASPLLEPMAQVLHEMDSAPEARSNPVALMMLLGGLAAYGSASQLDSWLIGQDLWERVRCSSVQAERVLPARQPTLSELEKFAKRNEAIGHRLIDPLLALSLPLFREAGMLVAREWDFREILRTNTIRADGTTLRHPTGLTKKEKERLLAEGVPVSDRAWVQDEVKTKKAGTRLSGIPVQSVIVDSGVPFLGGILCLRTHREQQETLAARQDLWRVIDAAAGAVEAVSYDGLLRGKDVEAILCRGAMPVVPLHQPSKKQKHVAVPEAALAGKCRAHFGIIKTFAHENGTCVHELWGVDGMIKTVRPGQNVTWDSPACVVEDIEFRRIEGGKTPYVYVLVPCKGSWVRVELDVRERREGHPKSSILNVWRPYPESEAIYQQIKGWRSPVEGVFSAMKRRLTEYDLSPRLKIDRLQLDLIGYVFRYNTVMWDVHLAQFTNIGSHQYTEIGRHNDRRQAA